MRWFGALVTALLLIPAGAAGAAALPLLPGPSQPVGYAPADRPGPPLSVPDADLDAGLRCSATVAPGAPAVLLVHGTASNPAANFSWNYQRVFDREQRPYCTVALPGNALGDIQVAAEHVVHALRTMNQVTGEPVDVIGYSQGGMIGRWALRFWPDTRSIVDDLVGIAPSNHGTVDADVLCLLGCAPAVHQQRPASAFLTALNAGSETFAGIDYTQIYTRLVDEVVVPNFSPDGSSALRSDTAGGGDGTIANIAVQDVCALRPSDHLTIGTVDPVAYALAVDAVDTDGTGDPARIDPAVCLALFMPGVDPATVGTDAAGFSTTIVTSLALTPGALLVPREPTLRPYVYG